MSSETLGQSCDSQATQTRMTASVLTPEQFREARTYAWQYFAVHADQRMKLFHFFLLLSGATFAVFPPLYAAADNSALTGFVPLVAAVSALVFWRLDIRTRSLVKNGEAALKTLDGMWPHDGTSEDPLIALRLIDQDDKDAQSRKRSWPVRHLLPTTYTDCFRLVYGVIGIVGLSLAVWSWRR